ncbi:MAG: Crp/Fnr family transcriptional regulator [Anaerolineales bacterium]|nr:Crp/Fnr family transcriptional regulator [Anaerolineales bacterium]
MEKYIKLLSSVSHFNKLKPSDLLKIINSGRLKHYRKDKFIYQQGDPGAGMFVLFSGKVHLCNYNCDGQIHIFSIIEPVIMFNELTVIDGGPNPATAIAVKDCLTWNISFEPFNQLVMRYPDPAIGLAMMRVLADRTRNLITLCGDLSFRSVLSRCAKLILDLSDQGTKIIDRAEFPLADLAARVSTAPESVSRSLSWLDNRGLISCDRHRISVQAADDLLDIVIEESS